MTETSGRNKEPRGAKRRRRTRERLIQAALHLAADRDLESVAINEITEEADIGLGSFYNHFPTKQALYDAMLDEVFEKFGDAIDAQIEQFDDPAEMISIAIRHTLYRAARHPDWGKLLIRVGFSETAMNRGLGVRLARDIATGINCGRFANKNLLIQSLSTGGAVLACLSFLIGLKEADNPSAIELGEQLAESILTNLGLPEDEARSIARIPLPTSSFEEAPVG